MMRQYCSDVAQELQIIIDLVAQLRCRWDAGGPHGAGCEVAIRLEESSTHCCSTAAGRVAEWCNTCAGRFAAVYERERHRFWKVVTACRKLREVMRG